MVQIMTLQEILKSQGLTDEQIQTITGEMKRNKVFTAGEENLDIRYKDLQTKFESKDKEHKEAVALIEQLKKDNADNDALQGKITDYETKMTALQKELEQTKVDAALKVALLEAKVLDVDYLTFKIKEKGEVKLTEDGKIKDIDSTISAMKTQYPSQFSSDSKKKIEENKLSNGDNKETGLSKSDILKKPYAERIKFFQENPDAYNEIMHSENN
jgi:hypothetical protein